MELHVRLHMELHMGSMWRPIWADRQSPSMLISLHQNKIETAIYIHMCYTYIYIYIHTGIHYTDIDAQLGQASRGNWHARWSAVLANDQPPIRNKGRPPLINVVAACLDTMTQGNTRPRTQAILGCMPPWATICTALNKGCTKGRTDRRCASGTLYKSH